MRQIFAAYGLLRQVVSDNDPQFCSEEFRGFTKENGIEHILCSPYHPSSNGAVERMVQTFKKAMKASSTSGLSVNHRLANFLLSYRTTPHMTTNKTPAELFLGRTLRTCLDLIRPDTRKVVERKQSQQKVKHDRHAHERTFQLEQTVMVRNFRNGPKWVRGVIIKRKGPVTYLVRVDNGTVWKRHVDHIRSSQVEESNALLPVEPEDVDRARDADGLNHDPLNTESDSEVDTTNHPETTTQQRNTSGPQFVKYPRREHKAPDRYM